MQAELKKLAQTPPNGIDREHTISLLLAYLGSGLKGVHDQRDFLAEDAEVRMQACIARAATSQLQTPILSELDHTRCWGHLHCTDNLKPYKKYRKELKDMMRALGLKLFICPEPLLSPSDYAALFKANIVIASPNSVIEQLAIALQLRDLNPLSLFLRSLTLSCDLDASQLALVEPPQKFRLFDFNDAISFIANTGITHPGRSFIKPVAPRPLTNHAELNYGIDFLQFAAGLEWNQRYLPADSPLLSRDKQLKISNRIDLLSRLLGELWVTAPEYFDPRHFHDNVSVFMARFGLDIEQKGIEEIAREMPEMYRQTEASVTRMAGMLETTSAPRNRLIDFRFQRVVTDWMRPVYWQELGNLWQECNRLIDARRDDGADTCAGFDADKELLNSLEATFRRNLRERLLECPYLAQTSGPGDRRHTTLAV